MLQLICITIENVVCVMDCCDVVRDLSEEVYKLHCDFSGNFFSDHPSYYTRYTNLKKLSISQIRSDDFFMFELIPDYMAKLNDSITLSEGLTNLQFEYGSHFRFRTKLPNTTEEKIENYFNKSKRFGDFYVSGTINDLLGIRIVLPGVNDEQDKINCCLENLRDRHVISRFYQRNDGDYHASHCYFQRDNKCFPWELQIWDTDDELVNNREHIRHENERKKGVELT